MSGDLITPAVAVIALVVWVVIGWWAIGWIDDHGGPEG